jgi:hypothetical protein
MRKALIVILAALALPAGASAQSLGLGVRAGTFGVGAELSYQLTDRIAVRGGYGVVPVEYSGDFGDITYTIEPTSPLPNIGIDLYPGRGGFRVGGGVLFVQDYTTLTAEYTGTVDVGGRTYSGSEAGTLIGLLDHGGIAPYATLGFGRTTARGIGLFVDLGAAFMEEPSVTLTASGPAANHPQFREDLERERQNLEEDARDYLRIWPIASIGLKIGLF